MRISNYRTEPLIKLLLTFGLWLFSTSIRIIFTNKRDKEESVRARWMTAWMGLDSWSYFYIPSIETVAAHHMVYHKRWNTHQNINNGHISHPSPKFHQKAAHHHRQSIEIEALAAQFWWPSIYNHMEQRQVGVDVDKRRLTVSSKEKKNVWWTHKCSAPSLCPFLFHLMFRLGCCLCTLMRSPHSSKTIGNYTAMSILVRF